MGIRVKALMTVFYDGRDRETGEEFETLDDMHAKVLMMSGRVVKVDEVSVPEHRGRYRHRAMRAQK